MPAGDVIEREGRRITGVDAARGLALIGMMAIQVLPERDDDGSVSLAFHLASGRASALFAVLAGVGLALGSGGTRPLTGEALAGARRAVAARAGVIAVLGLTLGSLQAPVAVILAYYGVLFLVAVPVLGWPAGRLAALAAACALAAPLLSHALRLTVDGQRGDNVQWADVGDPAYLLGSILLYGYYPVLTWTAYLFAGLAVGRLDLRRPRTAARVAACGGVLALGALGVDRLARSLAGGTGALAARLGTTPAELEARLSTTMYGTTPTDSPWWLLLAGRHSGSGPDLVHTGGSALLVLGCCLLVTPRVGRLATPLAAAGAMTLTLYTMHVLALGMAGTGGRYGQPSGQVVLVLHVVAAAGLALLVGAPQRRGPLEALAARAALAVRRPPAGPGPARDEPPSGATPPG